MLIPPVRKTWGPRGQTPVCRHRYSHKRISAISALSVSPKRRRMGLYFDLQHENFRQANVCDFLRQVLRHLRGEVIVVWDNAAIHKGAQIRRLCERFDRLHLEPLPSYAPELNPDEYVWSQSKNTLANSRPDDPTDLYLHLLDTLCDLSFSQRRLRACVRQSELSLFD